MAKCKCGKEAGKFLLCEDCYEKIKIQEEEDCNKKDINTL